VRKHDLLEGEEQAKADLASSGNGGALLLRHRRYLAHGVRDLRPVGVLKHHVDPVLMRDLVAREQDPNRQDQSRVNGWNGRGIDRVESRAVDIELPLPLDHAVGEECEVEIHDGSLVARRALG
jgi:hypothetical protein